MEVNEVCLSGQASGNNGGNHWLWLAMFFIFFMVVGLAVKGYFMLRQTASDLGHCWRQVADEDEHIARQESRIDSLVQKCESLENQLQQVLAELKDEIQTASNEISMVHNYAQGIHYSLVEHGGFLRNGFGLSHQQMVHLATIERANLVTARVMGSVEYMRSLRQRYVPQGKADETNTVPMETTEYGGETVTSPSSAESITGILDFLKVEHTRCLENMELRDANAIQGLILQFLEETREASGSTLVRQCCEKVSETFSEMQQRAIEQNRWESADSFQMFSRMYGPE